MKLQQVPRSAQAAKPTGGGDEGSETLLYCGSQPVGDAQLSWVSLGHFRSQLWAAGETDVYFLSRPTAMKVPKLFLSRNEEESILSNHSCIPSYSTELIQYPHFRSHLHPTQHALWVTQPGASSLSFRAVSHPGPEI